MKTLATLFLIPIMIISAFVAIPLIIWQYANELVIIFEEWYEKH